ncbi:hypothetical protein Tco_0532788 [Tanacetum coccineum]
MLCKAFIDEDLPLLDFDLKMRKRKLRRKSCIKDVEDSLDLLIYKLYCNPSSNYYPNDKKEELAESGRRAQKERQNKKKLLVLLSCRALMKFKRKHWGARKEQRHEGTNTYRTQVREQDVTYLNIMARRILKRDYSVQIVRRKFRKKLEEDNDAEKRSSSNSIDVVPRHDIAIDVESLATKFPIIDWKNTTF